MRKALKKSVAIISTLSSLLIGTLAFAQAPQKFNYQGIARDLKGNPMSKQQMALKLSVLPTADATVPEYEETQLVTTNEFGLYTLQIGNGTAITGDMKSVKWETGNKYIKVAIDAKGGSNYVDAGTTQLLSVPYALYADKAGNTAGTSSDTRAGAVSTSAAGTGTVNFLTKFTAANTIFNSQIFDNGAQIGIGTTTPATSAKVHITSATGTQPMIFESPQGVHCLFREGGVNRGYFGSFVGSGAAQGYPTPVGTSNDDFDIGTSSASVGKLHLVTNTTPRLTITPTTGNVGIGTVIPKVKLEVFSSLDTTVYVRGNTNNSAANGILRVDYTGTTLDDHVAVFGRSVPTLSDNYGIGLYGEGGYIGVQSLAKNTSTNTSYGSINEGSSRGETYGVLGIANSDIVGNFGSKVGVSGYALGGISNIGVYGDIDPAGGTSNYAGFFNNRVGVNGDLDVVGSISKAGGTFKIDHPLDPANKFLVHSFVESPDMMNVYNGNAITNTQGKAIIQLPAYFESANKDFRYQLTSIGERADVWVSQEVFNNQFEIATDKPNVKVSWQVTGIRNDKWAEANRYIPEPEKSASEKGKYLHPTLFGQPSEKQIGSNQRPAFKKEKVKK